MIYICAIGSPKSGSFQMNGVQVYNKLARRAIMVRSLNELVKVKNSIIIFYKHTIVLEPLFQRQHNLISALRKNNVLIYVTVDITYKPDIYCKLNTKFYNYFDYIVTPSAYFYSLNPAPRVIYIPHHYDVKLTSILPAQEKIDKILYIGEYQNWKNVSGNDNHSQYHNYVTFIDFPTLIKNINVYKKYKYHISFYGHPCTKFKLKPITKVATAAALDAVVLCVKSLETVRWLGEDYPFYLDGTDKNLQGVIDKICSGKITEDMYNQAHQKMLRLKEELSLDRIIKDHYEPLFEKIKRDNPSVLV